MDIENIDTEWKRQWSERYLKTIAAFHNTRGGRMIIGRDDDGSYVGVRDPVNMSKIIADTIRNKLRIVSSVENVDGVECIIVDVAKGSSIVSYESRYYMRVGSTTQELEDTDLKKVVLEERGMQWLDIPTSAAVSDLSSKAISYLIRKGKSCGRIPEEVDDDDHMAVLERFDLLRNGDVTLAAALLFSDNPRRYVFDAILRIGVFDESGFLVTDEEVICPLICMADIAVDSLYEKFIRPRYRYDGPGLCRILDELYPKEAVRELILNAVIHKDYSSDQPISVYIFPDRLEIFSSGGLPDGITTDLLMRRHKSIRRNKSLANVFYATGYVEMWGQGIPKVIAACAYNRNPIPEFVSESDGFTAILRPRDTRFAIPPFEESKGIKNMLDGAIFQLITDYPFITIADISRKTGVSASTVRRHISAMVENGRIARDGTGRSMRYRPL